jgi:HEAT repeat protein
MSERSGETSSNTLEYFKAFSTFFSSVVIALTGIYLTNRYNGQQLEIARQQARSQLALARLQEISKVIPKLGSSDKNERRFGAIALGLHGVDAIPPLLALLNDASPDVRLASAESISLIGTDAAPRLTEALLNKRNPTNLRSGAIYALGQMQADSAFSLAMDVLNNPAEDPIVRKDAASALGFLKDARGIPVLLDKLAESRTSDEEFAKNIVWALQEIADSRASPALVALIGTGSEELQIAAVWALANCSPAEAEAMLGGVSSDAAKSSRVREAADAAIKNAKKRGLSGSRAK